MQSPSRLNAVAGKAPPFYSWSQETLVQALGTEPVGLSSQEAEARLRQFGLNSAIQQPRRHLVVKIARKLTEPLVAILLIAALISVIAGDWASSSVIAAVVALSVALETWQERGAENAAEALKRSVAVHAAVWRNDHLIQLPIEDIVPGDLIALEAGDLVPADGIVVASQAAQANEALLTGEPFPVEKREILGRGDANALFAGTALVRGNATLWVVYTGASTRFGAIAAAIEAQTPPTAFERGIRRFGGLVLRLTAFLVLFVLAAQLAFHRPALESFLFAVALAVGLTPELLPMIMTVTLSRGAVRMAARKVVVKRLSAIHDLGAMDILCTDKTGTLTQAKIEMIDGIDASGRTSENVARLAVINSRNSTGVGSAMDDAILAHPLASSMDFAIFTKLADLPFDFERRAASVLMESSGQKLLIVKGAPEQVLAKCTSIETNGSEAVLSSSKRAEIDALHSTKAAEGYRSLAIARKRMLPDCQNIRREDETDLTFIGLCLFLDPPKETVATAISRLHAAGVGVKIISGDAEAVIKHLVTVLELPTQGMLTGAEIDELSDKQLAVRVQSVDLFARVSPEQKRRIIEALSTHNHVIGYLGDGINDGPAIRAADVGVSVQNASEVARQAADIILLEQDLGVIADGVEEGRRTFSNIMKYIRMGTSSNFGNMLSMAAASLLLPFIPLSPVQVLVNNLVYDLSETGIPFDYAETDELARPHMWDMHEVLRFTLVMGPLSSVFDLAMFAILRLWFSADVDTFRTAWFIESITTQILVIFVIRSMKPVWTTRIHPILVATSLGALVIALLLAAGPIRHLLGFVAINSSIWGTIVIMSAVYLLAAELCKPLIKRSTQPKSLHARQP